MDAEEILEQVEAGVDAKSLKTAQSTTGGLTLRERWRRTMFYQKVDVLPNFEFGYWAETLSEWHKQGLPPDIKDEPSAYQYFGIENWKTAPVNVMGMRPAFDYKVIEESADYITYRAGDGSVQQINKVGHKSIPRHLEFPVKDRQTWEDLKWRLKASPERVPANWSELAEKYNQRDYPLAVPIGSMIGVPRNWLGFENVAMMVHDDPELLEEIVETLCCLVCDTLERVLVDVEFDFGAGWEDICFNSGPIVGVAFMRDVVRPRYARITALLRKHGCHVAFTDCDGNILPVLDSFVNGGINCMFPVEVNGGSDPVLMRKKYPDLLMQGGFCKMKLTAGKPAIKAEMERLQPLVKHGGFLLGVDHRVQADVPLENYKYYLKLKREMMCVGGKPQYNEKKIG